MGCPAGTPTVGVAASTAGRARSGPGQRASGCGGSALAAISQASALTATTTSGGKTRGPSSPGHVDQAGQTLVEEAFTPIGEHLPRRVQASRDLVVAQTFGCVQHDPGSH